MALTRYCIHADSEETDGLLRNQDSFVVVPDQPSQEHVEIGINDCSGFFPAVRWLDKEDEYVPAGVDFFQVGVPVLVSWDATNIRWIIGAAAQTINDRIWLGVPSDVTVGVGNARLSFVAPDNRLQTCHLTGPRPATTVVLHNGRRSGGLVKVKFIEHGIAVLHKGVPFEEDIELPAGSKLELVALTTTVYSMVTYTENLGGPGFINSDFVYTEASLYAKTNTPYGVNTINDVIGIVLPADPSKDNFCEVLDVSGECINRYCYVIRNPANPGYTIDGFDENFIINLAWGQTLFVYDGEENWAINPDAIGAVGEDGVQGSQGYQGVHGPQGNPGVQGPTGIQGPPGVQGESGVGDDGPQGPQGEEGVSNIPGPQGDDGDTGPQGAQGSTGQDSNVAGPQGQTGAQGPRGFQGDTGSQGAPSTVPGPQGVKGDTGDTGVQGSQGADSVVPGPQGVIGDTGPQGVQGVQGATGDTGPQGVTGDTGPQGPQGFQGVEGSGSQSHVLNFHEDVDVPAPSDGQVLTWDVGSALWIPKTPRTVVGVTEFDYRITLPITAVPTAGRLSRDNADPTLATIIYMHKLDLSGDDMTLFIEAMQAGDWLNLHDDANVNDSEAYDVIGPPVLTGDVFAIPVVSFLVEGAPLVNNQILRVFWRVTQEGLEGPQGPQGETGDIGPQGETGVQGETGAQGDTGPQGDAGPQGDTGPQGADGADSTVAGPQGDAGPQGNTGAQGADSTVPGPQGATGAAGADGGTGPQGDTGFQGDTGPQGATGAASTVAGPQGVQGAKGTTGAQGTAGTDGAAGGVGPQGDDGATGDTGAQGADGADGSNGAQGTTGAQGEKGTTGNTGAQGATGAKGDTGAPSTVAGPQGAAGAKGAQGEPGPQGSTGSTGGAGPQGAKGNTGTAGADGDTGPQGSPGATGGAGPQGAKGNTGTAGRAVVVTVNATAPSSPVAGDVWIQP